ncbi:preprotein translocase subunit YajC [Actinopolymorpha alba]|uniref:preprotein translocase subunit YajC n=1 Tax=Actinopolymorpha alba TaxID=533267 RepID=UPI000360021F|nr:preprotein translocase subunit YajC [Actinopolymorpha alba]
MLLSQAASGSSLWALLLPILLLVLFWVVAIRPQRKRQRETTDMQRQLQPGQQVMTGAGLLATVHAVEDDVVVLEIAPGVYARHVRQAIVRIVEPKTSSSDSPSSSGDNTPSTDGPAS